METKNEERQIDSTKESKEKRNDDQNRYASNGYTGVETARIGSGCDGEPFLPVAARDRRGREMGTKRVRQTAALRRGTKKQRRASWSEESIRVVSDAEIGSHVRSRNKIKGWRTRKSPPGQDKRLLRKATEQLLNLLAYVVILKVIVVETVELVSFVVRVMG